MVVTANLAPTLVAKASSAMSPALASLATLTAIAALPMLTAAEGNAEDHDAEPNRRQTAGVFNTYSGGVSGCDGEDSGREGAGGHLPAARFAASESSLLLPADWSRGRRIGRGRQAGSWGSSMNDFTAKLADWLEGWPLVGRRASRPLRGGSDWRERGTF